MKKITIILVTLFLINSCAKENITNKNQEKIDNHYLYTFDSSKDLINAEDKEAEKIDKQLVVLSEVFIETLKNDKLRDYIYQKSLKNDGFVKIETLFDDYPEIKKEINSLISSNSYANEFNINSIEDIYSNMMHMGTKMFPVINLPNIDKFQNNTNFISTAGIEIEDNQSKKINDEIFSWFIKDNIRYEISLSEKNAIDNSLPIFVFTVHNNIEDYIDDTPMPIVNNEEIIDENTSGKTNWGTINNNHRINYRYEGSGSSEFTITGKSYGRCNIWSSIYSCTFDFYSTWGPYKHRLIASVPSWKINQTIYKTNYDLVESSSSYRFYFNTFERDWYSTAKHLGKVTKSGKSIRLKGKMVYPNEWYNASPNYLYLNRYTTTHYYGSYKGGINIRN